MIEFSESHINLNLQSKTKKEVIRELLDLSGCRKREKIYKKILEREDWMSTGIGKGIALPRLWGPEVIQAQLCIGRKKEGIDFKSLDQNPANLFFLLLTPTKEEYVKILAYLFKILSQDYLCRELQKTNDAKQIISLLHDNGV